MIHIVRASLPEWNRTLEEANMNKISRRDFLKGSVLVTGAAIVWSTIVPSSVFGADAPSNRITIGCIGTGGQGSGNMRGFNAKSDCQVVAVCDVDANLNEEGIADMPIKSYLRCVINPGTHQISVSTVR